MKKYLLALLMVLGMCGGAWGADYYVDCNLSSACAGGSGTSYRVTERDCGGDDGTRAWPDFSVLNHASNTPLQAGDTVIIRTGTYTISDSPVIRPPVSGTAGSRITYKVREEDEGIAHFIGQGEGQFAVRISNRSYITITGHDGETDTRRLKFTHFFRFLWIDDGAVSGAINSPISTYNEISYAEFSQGTTLRTLDYRGSTIYRGSKYNWVHNCTFGEYGFFTLNQDGGVVLEIGNSPASIEGDDSSYNVIENNKIYRGGHHVLGLHCRFNVVRNNFFHNEEWWEYNADPRWPNSGDDPLDENWDRYKYRSYRTIYMGGSYYPDDHGFNMLEGNRFGHSGANITTTNTGGEAIRLNQSNSILRYNHFYAHGYSGIRLSLVGPNGRTNDNSVYNNTIVSSGYMDPYDPGTAHSGSSLGRKPIVFWNGAYSGANFPTLFMNNAIKNNLIWKNHRFSTWSTSALNTYIGNDVGGGWTGCSGYDICGNTDIAGNWADGYGDGDLTGGNPLFVDMGSYDNPSIATGHGSPGNPYGSWDIEQYGEPGYTGCDPFSTNDPDLRLTAASPVINKGVHLTTAVGVGNSSISLVVVSAGYFQPGWGNGAGGGAVVEGDWIAIGTTINTVQIDSINYDTNTITLATSKTWADEDKVWLYKKSDGVQVLYGVAPDTGAHEYVIDDPDECTTDPEDDCVSGVCNEAVSPTICVPCLDDDTGCSSPTPACKNGGTLQATCVECDAGDATECTGGTAVCDLDTNTCVECNVTADCTAEVCNTATHVCVECTLDTHCGDAETCSLTGATANTCVSTCGNGTVETGRNEVCDTAHTLGVYPGCESDEYCPDGCLSACVEKPQCATNANCTPPEYCQDAGELTAICVNKCGDGILDNLDNATTGQQALGEECEIGIPCSGEEAGNYCGIDCQCIAVAADICSSDIDCSEGSRCINRNCTDQYECLTDDHCATGFCWGGTCTGSATCVTDAHCWWMSWPSVGKVPVGDVRCINGICTANCYADSHCAAEEVCQDGNCVELVGTAFCYGDDECGVGFLCVSNNCVELVCRNAYDCDDGETCKNNECVTATDCDWDDDCLAGQVCQDGACTTTGKRQYIIVPGITTSN